MYLFLHMPKTAGTSLREALAGQFNEQDVALCYGRYEIEDKLREALKVRKKLIYGHIKFSHLLETAGHEDYQKLTFFRHPLQRCVSGYIHFLHAPDEILRQEAEEMGGFEGFLDSKYAHNWSCQHLAGFNYDPANGGNDKELFEAARENFEKLDWVGITEDYLNAMISLQHFMGLKHIPPITTNTSLNRAMKDELEQKYSREILVRNQQDIKLWNLARERHNRQLTEVPYFQLKKLKYRLTNALKQ